MMKYAAAYSISLALIVFFQISCADSPSASSDTVAPSLVLYSPKSNDTLLYGKTEIIFEAYDDQGLHSIDVFLDGTKVSTAYVKEGVRPPVYLEFDSSQTGTKHFYSITVYDASGNQAKSQAMTNILVTNTKSSPPAVIDVRALRISETMVNISWRDTSKFAKGYALQRKMGYSGNFSDVAVLPYGTNNTNDQISDPGQIYFYRLRSYNDFGSSYSAVVSSTGAGGSGRVPAPSNFVVTALGTKKVLLSWQNNASNVTYFQVERKTYNAFSVISVLPPGSVSYLDSANGLTAGGEFTYRVKVFTTIDSAWTVEKSVTTFPYEINRPTNLAATRHNQKTVKLTWKDNSIYEIATQVERKSLANTQWTVVGSVATDITVFYDSLNTQTNTRYWYRVRSTDGSLYSDYSDETWADLTGTGVAAPSNLTTAVLGTNRVRLTWQDNSPNELGFEVQRKTWWDYITIASLPANSTSYLDSANGLVGGSQYSYRIKAYDALDSSFSGEKTITTSNFDLLKPTNLTLTRTSAYVVTLNWIDNNWNEAETIIEKRSTGNPNFLEWGRVGANKTTWSDTMNITWLNTRVYYRVKAVNGLIVSEYSDEAWLDLTEPNGAVLRVKEKGEK